MWILLKRCGVQRRGFMLEVWKVEFELKTSLLLFFLKNYGGENHKICKINHFKAKILVPFIMFITLCNHHLYLVPKIFHHSKIKTQLSSFNHGDISLVTHIAVSSLPSSCLSSILPSRLPLGFHRSPRTAQLSSALCWSGLDALTETSEREQLEETCSSLNSPELRNQVPSIFCSPPART